jgi:hypothetical protein
LAEWSPSGYLRMFPTLEPVERRPGDDADPLAPRRVNIHPPG